MSSPESPLLALTGQVREQGHHDTATGRLRGMEDRSVAAQLQFDTNLTVAVSPQDRAMDARQPAGPGTCQECHDASSALVARLAQVDSEEVSPRGIYCRIQR